MKCLSGNTISPECYETILHTMAEGLIVVDTSCVIRFCNRSLEMMSGLSTNEIIGKRCFDIMTCSCSSSSECSLARDGSMAGIECQLKKADGTLLTILKNGRNLKNDTGESVGNIETITDISALKQEQYKNEELAERINREIGSFHLLVGKSKPMQDVFDQIELAANSVDTTILVTGETGTGKELVARTIHEKSTRKDGPLVKVNCSALSEQLLESELFGHTKGSFTGAIKDKVGRFEMADGGTLFLDEIGELSPYIQVKLLRFLQEKEFERVGEGITRHSNVRIIAATHRDLRERVSQGLFREDLFYRLKIFPLHLPPLRMRKDDLGILIRHFIEKFNRRTGKQIAGLVPDAAMILMDYCWPGNIRELENAIEHAFVTCGSNKIGFFDLPLEIRHVELRPEQCRKNITAPTLPTTALNTGNRIVSKDQIENALRLNSGNRKKAALSLHINRTTLWRYIRKYNLNFRPDPALPL